MRKWGNLSQSRAIFPRKTFLKGKNIKQPMSRKSYEKIHQILTLTFKLNTNISGVLSLDGLSFIILI